MIKSIFAATAALVAVSAASASAASINITKPKIETVAEKVNHDPGRPHHRWHKRWRNNDWRDDDPRYERYRGWHRYHHRPHGWRNRGCVAIGPIWFCP